MSPRVAAVLLEDLRPRRERLLQLLDDAIATGDPTLEERARQLLAPVEADIHRFQRCVSREQRELRKLRSEANRLWLRRRMIDREINACLRGMLVRRVVRPSHGAPRARPRHRGHAPRRGPPRPRPCDIDPRLGSSS